MLKKTLSIALLVLLLAFLGLTLWALPRLPELERRMVEHLANQAAKEYSQGPLHIDRVTFDRHLKIRIEGIHGKLKTRQAPVPLEVRSLESQDPLWLFPTGKPVRFVFSGVRPQGSPRPGISGTFTIRGRQSPELELTADFGETDLADWQWLDPQNLKGATGATKGHLHFRQTADKAPEFDLKLEAPRPGGNIQARFFDLFLPYLPTPLQKERVRKLSETEQVVRYDEASVEVQLPQSDRIKILLRIFIPDYNLKLTLNAEVRTDEKDAFSQVAQIMGLIEVK